MTQAQMGEYVSQEPVGGGSVHAWTTGGGTGVLSQMIAYLRDIIGNSK
jgi:hypothetical protein